MLSRELSLGAHVNEDDLYAAMGALHERKAGTRNTIQPLIPGVKAFDNTTLPNPFQRRAFELLQVPIP